MPTPLTIKIFADGADLAGMLAMAANPLIQGLTTNPTLMRQAGVRDYRGFAKEVLAGITDKPISFEVFSDDFDEMERQATEIASWGSNVNVKIPITNTRGESAAPLVARLSAAGVKVNVTAMMTRAQVRSVAASLSAGAGGYVSVFAGRIADAGVDPVPVMREIVEDLQVLPGVELIWASPREVFNIIQADAIGCHIITVTNALIAKMATFGKDLDQFSLETVRMFHTDAQAAGYTL
ncbi:MAG: transaldolase [Bacteroidota bacterium]|jgi:transaldolase|nr:transaldolase [Bacteroidota bacterium]